MSIGSWLSGLLGTVTSATIVSDEDNMIDPGRINPATGLPMIGGLDSMGNPWGADLSPPDHYEHGHMSGFWHDMSSIGLAVPDYSSSSIGHDPYYD
jgi:hypothetical protein